MARRKTINVMAKPAPKKEKVSQKKCADKADCSSAKQDGAKSVCNAKPVASDNLTRVIVKYNAGWGNQLFIRGVGAGLDWNKGVMLQCIGDDEWLWEARVPCGSVSFKLLINDDTWCQGEDSSVVTGETVICHPVF